MSKKLLEVKLSAEARKDLVKRFITAINDDVENLNAVFSAYGNDEYLTGTVVPGVKDRILCERVDEFMKSNGLFGAKFILVFRRRALSGSTLEHNYLMSTMTGVEQGSSIVHSLGSINVPYDQFEAQGLYEVPEGVYSLGMLVEGPFVTEEVPEEPEKAATEEATPVDEEKQPETPAE